MKNAVINPLKIVRCVVLHYYTYIQEWCFSTSLSALAPGGHFTWCLYSTRSCFHSLQGSGERRRNSSTSLFWPLVCDAHVSFTFVIVHLFPFTYTIAGLMVPLPATITTLTLKKYGYRIGTPPPFTCVPANAYLYFYSMIIVPNVPLVVGIPMLIIVAWSLRKVWFIY